MLLVSLLTRMIITQCQVSSQHTHTPSFPLFWLPLYGYATPERGEQRAVLIIPGMIGEWYMLCCVWPATVHSEAASAEKPPVADVTLCSSSLFTHGPLSFGSTLVPLHISSSKASSTVLTEDLSGRCRTVWVRSRRDICQCFSVCGTPFLPRCSGRLIPVRLWYTYAS